ncbi:hypothetical protein ASF70_22685 [Rhizobium sp. Leaf321]|nr:hypothetical protein ASF70_22685 [Rhizobium sp. Leaf321]
MHFPIDQTAICRAGSPDQGQAWIASIRRTAALVNELPTFTPLLYPALILKPLSMPQHETERRNKMVAC